MKSSRMWAAICSLTLLALGITPARAQDVWIGPPGPGPNNNWFNNNNWMDGSFPTGGDNAQINNTGTARINNAAASANNLGLGFNTGQAGNVNVAGTGSLSINNNLIVGRGSSSILSTALFQDTSVVTNGGFAAIGNLAGSMGEVRVRDSSHWTSTGTIRVGDAGTGSLIIRDAAKVVTHDDLVVGNAVGATGTVDVTGTFMKGSNDFNLTSDGNTIIGNTGDSTTLNTMDIHNGGRVATGNNAIIGNNAGSNGLVRVRDDGTNSESYWFIQNNLAVGNHGIGELQIRAGGFAGTFSGDVDIGRFTGSMGTVSVAGSGAQDGASLLQVGNNLIVGDEGTGGLRVTDGGNVTVANNMAVGNASGGSGEVVIRDDATLSVTNDLVVGRGGSGTMEIHDTGAVTTGGNGIIGGSAGATGEVRVTDDGNWTITGNLTVGDAGDGTLRVVNSDSTPLVEASLIVVGNETGSTGLIELNSTTAPSGLSPAMLISNSDTVIGNEGDGTMRIENGAFGATLGNAFIGRSAGGTGHVVVTGFNVFPSEWDVTGELTVGNAGNGVLEILDGGLVGGPFVSNNVFIGRLSGSMGKVRVDGAGSTLNANDLFVGGDTGGPGGDGELRITDGGTVNVANNMTVWGPGSGNKGALVVDSGYTLNVTGILTFDGGRLAFLDDTDFINDIVLGTSQSPNGIFVDTNGTTSTISGLISGGGRLVKRDDGTLILTRDNTFTGRTVVEQGTLQIDGAVGGSASVRAAGTLTGVYDGVASNVTRNLRNRGIVSPGDNPGEAAIFQVGRDFTNHPEGSLFVDVGGLTEGVDTDLLRILGGASIEGGTLQATRINGFAPTPGDRVTVLRTDSGRTGEFDALVPIGWGGLIQPVDVYDDPLTVDIVFELSNSFASQALNRNELCVAENLDHIVLETDFANIPGANDLITLLGNVPVGQLPLAFELLSPDEYSALYTISFSQATVENTNLQRHLDAVRTGSGGYCPPSVEIQPMPKDYNPPISDKNVAISDKNAVAPPPPIVPQECRWSLWATGTGQWVGVDGHDHRFDDSSDDDDRFGPRGYDIATGGFIGGVDFRVNDHFIVGLSGAFSSGEADLDDNFGIHNLGDDGHVDVDGGKIGGYATMFAGGFYVDVAGSAGWNNYDLRRTGLAPGTDATGALVVSTETLNGDTDGFEWNGMVGAGYDFHKGCFTFGPTATIQVTNVDIDSFTEHASDSSSDSAHSFAGAHFPDQDETSVRGTFGIKAAWDWHMGRTIVRPEVRAAWLHDFEDTDYHIRWAFDSNIVGDDRHFCNVFGPNLGQDAAQVGAGVSIQFTRCAALYAYYDGMFGDHYDSHAGSGGLRFGF